MNGTFKYRLIAISLATVFTLFNVGIPVIIASCPMAAMMKGNACAMCDTQDRTGALTMTKARNTSCCTTVIVAERNTTEFLQVKEKAREAGMVALPAVLSQAAAAMLPLSSTTPVSASPPAFVDIPILISSLLI